MAATKTYDVAVVGAGVFGTWTAYQLKQRGMKVALLDAYGPSNSRASSAGESRIIRFGYGKDEIYSRWAMRALPLWRQFSDRVRQPLFNQTGVLWLAHRPDGYEQDCLATLTKLGASCKRLGREEVGHAYPQFNLDSVTWALFEPESGVLMARQAVQAVVAEAQREGVEYLNAQVPAPQGSGKIACLALQNGESVSAGTFVFACGPWLPKVFPDVLASRIFPTRQTVLFFAPPPGDMSFAPPAMPCWFHHPALVYGIPDLENRGFKISIDRHGPAFDPDTGSRVPGGEEIGAARAYLEQRFPKLRGAPLTESRVCQYENTSNGDFILDRHPHLENVVIAGGGSGHGFKHGPAVGDYVARLLTGGIEAEPRFALAAKAAVQSRSVY